MQTPLDLTIFNAFVQRLAAHDWHYDYSDDGNVWRRGKANQAQLVEVANSHPLLKQAFDAHQNAAFHNLYRAKLDSVIATLRAQLQPEPLTVDHLPNTTGDSLEGAMTWAAAQAA